jgi:hypothetical protein
MAEQTCEAQATGGVLLFGGYLDAGLELTSSASHHDT